MPASLGSPRVILVPTALELARLRDLGGWPNGVALVALAGFGPVAAAARAATLFAQLRPRRALLVGIAGSYDAARWPVGSATEFASCAIDGVGVGEGLAFRGPPALGFPQWPGGVDDPSVRIDDRVALAPLDTTRAAELLVSTCAASDGPELAARRRARFPAACAEDMEGFGVALAAALADVPLSIVRGISNEVGDREPSRWRIPLALGAARKLALELLERDDAAGARD